jgi:hypothetical protein
MRAWIAVLLLLCGVSSASAQTVVVTQAEPATAVDVVVVREATVVASGTVGSDRVARVAFPDDARLTSAIDARMYVDACPERRRVIIVERGRPAAPVDAGCARQEIPGLYLVRPISTLAVDVSASPPRLLLIQGRFDPLAPPRSWAEVPTGLILSGAAGMGMFSDPRTRACGNAPECSADGIRISTGAAVAYWFNPFVAAEVGFVRPREWQASGGGTVQSFTSTLDAEMFTVAGLVGGPVGPARLYGKAGTNFHRATFSTVQTIDEITVDVDGIARLIQGGTQTLAYRTTGWGWLFGGGFEVWLSRWAAIHAEVAFAPMRGGDVDGGEAIARDRLMTIVGGVKVRVGR